MYDAATMKARHPNILLFMLDDLRFDALGATCGGASGAGSGGAVRTPHIDRLIARGCLFERAQIEGGTIGAVCMPSRAVLHTGRHLFHLQDHGRTIPRGHTLLGEHLRAHGYTCFTTGKWHNGAESLARSFDSGDDIFFGGMDDHWNVPVHHFDPAGRYDHRLPAIAGPQQNKTISHRSGSHIHAGVHSTDLFTDAAIRFIEGHDGARPFFASVNLTAPHDPRSTHDRFHAMYEPDDIELPPNFLAQHPHDTGALRIRDETLAAIPRDAKEVREHIADYHAMITHLDEAFGRLMAALEARGMLDDTIVALTADHGLAVGRHGLLGKQNCYEHSVRIPLVLAGPGVPQGRRSRADALLADLFPTLCDMTGIPVPPSVQGRSLRGALSGDDEVVRDAVYMAYGDAVRAVRAGRMKLIEYAGPAARATQLFDLSTDPWERHNLALERRCGDDLARLRSHLAAQRDAVGDPAHPCEQAFWATMERG